ncbi:vancomycin resistance protein [Bacillus sp. UMB0899]|nr:vancomycin resistance protein [Bacillus sp. UMB0899]
MRKKCVSTMILLFMMAGCSSNVANGSQKEEILPVNEMTTHLSQLSEKKVEFAVKLLHPKTKEILYSFIPTVHKNQDEYKKEIAEIADHLANSLDQALVPAKYTGNGNLSEGKSRVLLDESKLVDMLLNVGPLDKTLDLPMEVTEPNVTAETVKGVNEAVIGSYKTSFDPSVTGRSQNIFLSANEINQIVLGPGDRFYFNLVVGERTTARGYQKAKEIVNKEFVYGIGGGICQTSSTLYNAVADAGLEIIELHSHSRSVGYVPAGRDATVSWGGPDFKFMNNKDYPVMIKTIVNKQSGSIEVQILASKQNAAKI